MTPFRSPKVTKRWQKEQGDGMEEHFNTFQNIAKDNKSR